MLKIHAGPGNKGRFYSAVKRFLSTDYFVFTFCHIEMFQITQQFYVEMENTIF